jgi:hypothetical protein
VSGPWKFASTASPPLLNEQGRVVGILGGSVTPGARFDPRHMGISPGLGIALNSINAATPWSAVVRPAGGPSKLAELAAKQVLTEALSDTGAPFYVTTSSEVGKNITDALPHDVCEFSRHDSQVWVLSEWQKQGKATKGLFSAKVYDYQNHVRVLVEPKKLTLSPALTRSVFSFAPAQLEAGVYRIDLVWDGRSVWRTFIRVTD